MKTSALDVPIIDLSLDEGEIVKQIASACSTIGLFQVKGHGISEGLIKKYKEQCALYFALPHDQKLKWKRNESNARGYFDDELTKQKRDWKEALDFGVPRSRSWLIPDSDPSNICLDGFNQLPSEDMLSSFRPTVTAYFDACADLSARIALLMAKGIGGGETSDIISDLREHHSSYLRINHYPPCENNPENMASAPLGISPHKDAGFLTVLLQDDDCHSLQVFADEQWMTIHPEPGALTINTGDMAEVWSNSKYKAPLHRVLTNDSMERYSSPFFYNPSYGCLVKPVVENEDEAVYHPVLWGYFRGIRFAGDLTDLGVEIQIEHFEKVGSSNHPMRQAAFLKMADFTEAFSVEKYRDLLTSDDF